jgi:hypothetical protein
VQDLYPGQTGSLPSSLFPLNQRLLFTAYHPVYGNELMSIDPVTVSVEEELHAALRVYPNPTSGVLHVEAERRIQQATLFSLAGVEIQDFEIGAFSAVLDVAGKGAIGLYLLWMSFENGEEAYVRVWVE